MLLYWKSSDGAEYSFRELPDFIVQSATKFALLETRYSGIELYPAYTFKAPACRASVSDLREAGESLAKRFSLFLIDLNGERDAIDILALVSCLKSMVQANASAQFIFFSASFSQLFQIISSEIGGPLSHFRLHRASLYDPNSGRRIEARLHYIQGTLALEGLALSEGARNLCRALFDGKVELDDAVSSLVQLYDIKLDRFQYVQVSQLSDELVQNIDADLFAVHLSDLFIYPEKTPQKKYTMTYLNKLHKRLFSRFSLAGKPRSVDIIKQETRFEPHLFVRESIKSLTSSIQPLQWARLSSVEEAASLVAFYLSELNYIHCFRDGNGRLGREFLRILLSLGGFEPDWSGVPAGRFLEAMKLSVFDPTDLERIMLRCIHKGGKD